MTMEEFISCYQVGEAVLKTILLCMAGEFILLIYFYGLSV